MEGSEEGEDSGGAAGEGEGYGGSLGEGKRRGWGDWERETPGVEVRQSCSEFQDFSPQIERVEAMVALTARDEDGEVQF